MSGPDFLRRTPSQVAFGPDTTEDERLWRQLKDSPVAQEIRKSNAQASLERRRQLVARTQEERQRLATFAESLERQKREASDRLLKAEREFRAALEASRSLPLWAPDGSQLIIDCERELRETADPRIAEWEAWLSRQISVTRAYGPRFEVTMGDHGRPLDSGKTEESASYNQSVLLALGSRMQAINAALHEMGKLKLCVLTEDQVTAEIERIIATVPPIPSEASQHGMLPTPVLIDSKTHRAKDGTLAPVRSYTPEENGRLQRAAELAADYERIVAKEKRR